MREEVFTSSLPRKLFAIFLVLQIIPLSLAARWLDYTEGWQLYMALMTGVVGFAAGYMLWQAFTMKITIRDNKLIDHLNETTIEISAVREIRGYKMHKSFFTAYQAISGDEIIEFTSNMPLNGKFLGKRLITRLGELLPQLKISTGVNFQKKKNRKSGLHIAFLLGVLPFFIVYFPIYKSDLWIMFLNR